MAGTPNPITDFLDKTETTQPSGFVPRPPDDQNTDHAPNPITDFLQSPNTPSNGPNLSIANVAPTAPISDAAARGSASNPITDFLQGDVAKSTSLLSPQEREQSSRPDPENNEDEPWYSKTWNWLNKPLYDAHQWGARTGAGTIERGVESGVEDLISGLSSPLSLALAVGTFGAGGVLGGAAEAGLQAIGVSEEAAPFVAKGIKTLMGAGFTAQNVTGLLTQVPQALDALKAGDTETATRLLVDATATGALTAMAASQAFEDGKLVTDRISGKTPEFKESLATAKKTAGDFDVDKAIAAQRATEFTNKYRAKLKAIGAEDEITQAAIRKVHTADGDLNLLKNQGDTIEGALPVRDLIPEEVEAGTKAPEFKKWFEGSKLADANGKPVVLYPKADGAFGPAFTDEQQEPITVYRGGAEGDTGRFGSPHYAENENYAKNFANEKGRSVLKSQIQPKNPLDINTAQGSEAVAKAIAESASKEHDPQFAKEIQNNGISHIDKKAARILKDQGYDFITQAHDYGSAKTSGRTWIELDPSYASKETLASQGVHVKIANVKEFGSKAQLDKFIADGGSLDHAKNTLLSSGFDGIKYKNADGVPVVEPLDTNQVRNAQASGVAVNSLWNRDFVYHATDASNTEQILNSGIKHPSQQTAEYATSPEEALKFYRKNNPEQGLNQQVYAVPRAEIEAGLNKGSLPEGRIETDKNHMPTHRIEVDPKTGELTGQITPLDADQGVMNLRRKRFDANYTPEEKQKLVDIYRRTQNLTPEQYAFAISLRMFYEGQFNKAHAAGIIREAVQNYHPQAWASGKPGVFQRLFRFDANGEDVSNPAFDSLRYQTDHGAFDTNVSAAKHRAFETEFQGEMAGYKNKSNDLAKTAGDYRYNLDKAIASRKYLEDLRSKMVAASDGRPGAVLAGSAQVMGAESGNPALAVNPQAIKSRVISHELIQNMMQKINPETGYNSLKSAIDKGTIEKLPYNREWLNPNTGQTEQVPAYAHSSDGYVKIDHPAMRDWGYIGQDAAGNPAIMKGDIRVHPEMADYVRQVIGAEKPSNAYLKAANAISGEAKGLLLSFSPFHAAQEMMRALMIGINPIGKLGEVDVANDVLLQKGIRNSLTLKDYKAEDMFSEGVASHSKIISKIPGLNKLQNGINKFTFEKLIPNLKARAFKSVYERFDAAMRGASGDEVAHAAAQYVNDTFGGQNWRDLGVASSSQELMRATALAPDWLTSEMRSLYRAAGGQGKAAAGIARADLLRITAGMYVTARVLNMLHSGGMHQEAPFGLVQPGQNGEPDKIYSMRTLPTDLVHAIAEPRDFVTGRLNPLTVKPAIEGLTGRDQFGRKVTGPQEIRDIGRNVAPIGAQSLIRGNPTGASTVDQLVKAAGATVYKYRTEAEKIAQQIASDHMPTGPVDDAELAAHQKVLKAEDGLRNGQIGKGDVRREFTIREADQIIKNANYTPLQARFERLPLGDALRVWEVATPQERDSLHRQLWSKRISYLKSHTPVERANDPVYAKLQKTMGDLYGRS